MSSNIRLTQTPIRRSASTSKRRQDQSRFDFLAVSPKQGRCCLLLLLLLTRCSPYPGISSNPPTLKPPAPLTPDPLTCHDAVTRLPRLRDARCRPPNCNLRGESPSTAPWQAPVPTGGPDMNTSCKVAGAATPWAHGINGRDICRTAFFCFFDVRDKGLCRGSRLCG